MARTYTVDVALVASTATVTLGGAEEIVEVHLEYFTDDTYTTPATPGAGTAVVTGTRKDDFTQVLGTFDCTDVTSFISGVANFKEIAVVPTGITTAVSYRAFVTVTDAG